jgi:hypothetical protein
MTDDETTQQTQESGQEPTTAEGESAEAQDAEAWDPERAQATIRKLRGTEKLAKQYARELEQLRAQIQQHESEKLSETERLQRQVAELERRAAQAERERQERTLRYETMLAAGRLGIVDPDAAWRLIDPAALEYDEDGSPTNVEAVLRDLIRKRPYLAGGSAGQIGATSPARADTNPTFSRAQLRDPAFFAQNRDAIMRAMREGRITD